MSADPHWWNTHAGDAGILSVGRDHLLTVLGVAICSLVHLTTCLKSVGEDRDTYGRQPDFALFSTLCQLRKEYIWTSEMTFAVMRALKDF